MEKDKELYSRSCIVPVKEVIGGEVEEKKSFGIDFSTAEKFTIEELKIVEEFINEMIRQELEIAKLLKRKTLPNTLKLPENFKVEIIK